MEYYEWNVDLVEVIEGEEEDDFEDDEEEDEEEYSN